MNRTRILLVGSSLLLLGVATLWALWSRCGLEGCPDVERLRGFVPDEASILLDRTGSEIGHLYSVNRLVVPLDSLPPYLPSAFIAIEDQRFWRHRGVDWYRVLGAAWANIRARRVEEGFSTITMQLARNVFPQRIPQSQRTLRRKLTEVRVAGQIERHFTKPQILELYLNQIYFGAGAYGIEAAAAEYFDKPASELTLAEASLLAGMIRAPQRLDPRRNPEGARRRSRVVVERMAEQGLIDDPTLESARAEEFQLRQGRPPGSGEAPYFIEEVRLFLEDELGESLYTGGYRIRTTLDPAVQGIAESELESQLRAIESGRYGRYRHLARSSAAGDSSGERVPGYLQGAIVVMDPGTGEVLALVGGRDFGDSKFDRVVQGWRQPGSAFKPIVYGAALAAGLPPTLELSDEPLRRVLPDGTVWTPRNFEGSYRGDLSMRQALAQSRNVATIRLAEEVGLDEVIDFARRVGLTGPIPRVPSIAIGSAEVTLLELTTAYATFATLGLRPVPRLVTRVEDRDGRVVWEGGASARRVLDPAIAFLLTDLLRGVVDYGTGTAVRGAGFRGAAAGKTGTTNGETDLWFLGYTPERVAGVWIGFDRPQSVLPGATGGKLAAPVWGRVMRRTHPPGNRGWTMPPGIVQYQVDAEGRLYREGCLTNGEPRAEYFLAGTAPIDSCTTHPPDPLGRPYDSMPWPDSGLVHPDSISGHPGGRDSLWWDELQRRLYGDEPTDSERSRVPADTSRQRAPAGAGERPGQTEPRDSGLVQPAPHGTTAGSPEPGSGLLGEPAPP